MHGFFLRLKTVTFSALILGAGLSLASCGGNGSLFGNGSGSASSATAANQIAGIDIANGNYSGAIAVLSPFCPNNNCQNSDLANTLANAYMAMGNSSAGASVTGATSVTGASGGGATVSQILSSVLNLVNGGPAHPPRRSSRPSFRPFPASATIPAPRPISTTWPPPCRFWPTPPAPDRPPSPTTVPTPPPSSWPTCSTSWRRRNMTQELSTIMAHGKSAQKTARD